jgi:hypothetical protein
MASKEILKEKIQVLLSEDDLGELSSIIMRKALEMKKRPEPISLYVRDLIKTHILENQTQQKSFVKDKIKKLKSE